MKFKQTITVFEGQNLWKATEGPFTFVISKESDEPYYLASAKQIGLLPFEPGRVDLGSFNSFAEAQAGCEEFLRKEVQ